MNSAEFKQRTKLFALNVIQLVRTLPNTQDSKIIGKQLLRSATSVAANYRAACRARSKNDFISKLGIVEEEADESMFWIELLIESKIIRPQSVQHLLKESNEIVAIIVASKKTARLKK